MSISIHAPRAGCDLGCLFCPLGSPVFQSTHPVRGATASSVTAVLVTGNFNPRTPCGVRRPRRSRLAADAAFQSTHPVRGATSRLVQLCRTAYHFNPRTPCGVRPRARAYACARNTNFNPRTPCGVRRPFDSAYALCDIDFNPRTPCGVRPSARKLILCSWKYFNPRTPCGVRLAQMIKLYGLTNISIHAPRAGCDNAAAINAAEESDFNPRTPCGVRRTGRRMNNDTD